MNTVVLLCIFGIGTIFGSFLNALIWRTYVGKNMSGRSMCPSCSTELKAFELIPVFSFLLQRGKCRNCLVHISWQYPMVELVTGLLFVLVVYMWGLDDVMTLSFGWFLVLIAIFIFVYDLRYQLILDRVTLPAIAIALIYNTCFAHDMWGNYVFGAVLGAGFFLLQFVVSNGRWIGGGDIRLGALMGAVLGWKLLLVALLVAYVVGAIVSVALVVLKKKTMASTTPFGTYLVAAMIVTLFWGKDLLDWYIGLLV